VALRGAVDKRACAKLGAYAGAPIDPAMVDADLRKLHATGWYDDLNATEIEDAGTLSLVYEVRERPALGDVEVIGAPKGVSTFEAVGLKPERVDPVWVRATEQRLLDALHFAGYRAAQVAHEVVRGKAGAAKLALRIEPGARTVLGAVRIEGLVTAREAELRKELGLRPGEPAPAELIERDGLVISAGLYDVGLIQSDVRTQLVDNPATATVDVVFTVIEGPVFQFGKIGVSGKGALPAERYRAILAPLKRGAIFQRAAVVAAIQAIEALHRDTGTPKRVEPISNVDPSKHIVSLDLQLVNP
jgi:outer membrane protein insertion porin family